MPEVFRIYTETGEVLSPYSGIGFDDVPVVSPCRMTIVSDGSKEGRLFADELTRDLREALIMSGPAVIANDLPDVTLENVTAPERGTSNLLVLVGGGQGKFVYRPWFADFPVLPVLRQGTSISGAFGDAQFGDILKTNIAFWSDWISEVVPSAFSRVGLTTEEQRVFISYRRIETQPLALQLFDALTHAGLDVFLDRFSIAPGLNFQQRLYQELAEKSMVLLLESEWLSSSEWTQIEIDHCKKYRLGLLAVQMPEVPADKAVGSIGIDLRHKLELEQFAAAPQIVDNPLYRGVAGDPEPQEVKQWQTLKTDALRNLVLEIRKVHDRALFRRRTYLRDVMSTALNEAAPHSFTLDDAGMLVVSGKHGKRYSVWLTTRPPELPDFHVTHLRTAIPPQNIGVVIGPLALLEPQCKTRLDWLSGVSKMKCIDESQIAAAAAELVAGTL